MTTNISRKRWLTLAAILGIFAGLVGMGWACLLAMAFSRGDEEGSHYGSVIALGFLLALYVGQSSGPTAPSNSDSAPSGPGPTGGSR